MEEKQTELETENK